MSRKSHVAQIKLWLLLVFRPRYRHDTVRYREVNPPGRRDQCSAGGQLSQARLQRHVLGAKKLRSATQILMLRVPLSAQLVASTSNNTPPDEAMTCSRSITHSSHSYSFWALLHARQRRLRSLAGGCRSSCGGRALHALHTALGYQDDSPHCIAEPFSRRLRRQAQGSTRCKSVP